MSKLESATGSCRDTMESEEVQIDFCDDIIRALTSFPKKQATSYELYMWMMKYVRCCRITPDKIWKKLVLDQLNKQTYFMKVMNTSIDDDGAGRKKFKWTINYNLIKILDRPKPMEGPSTSVSVLKPKLNSYITFINVYSAHFQYDPNLFYYIQWTDTQYFYVISSSYLMGHLVSNKLLQLYYNPGGTILLNQLPKDKMDLIANSDVHYKIKQFLLGCIPNGHTSNKAMIPSTPATPPNPEPTQITTPLVPLADITPSHPQFVELMLGDLTTPTLTPLERAPIDPQFYASVSKEIEIYINKIKDGLIPRTVSVDVMDEIDDVMSVINKDMHLFLE